VSDPFNAPSSSANTQRQSLHANDHENIDNRKNPQYNYNEEVQTYMDLELYRQKF